MKQIEDFKKAVKKRVWGNIAGTIICGFLAFILFSISYSFYSIDQDISFMLILVGIFLSLFSIGSFMDTLDIIFNPKKFDNHILCKRCKELIDKDKIFCNDCKHDIKRSLRRTEDKQYFNDYKKMIKQKEKNKDKKK